jgi:hypothetical protein
LAGKPEKTAVHVGKSEKAMANLAIGLPNVPDRFCAAGRKTERLLASSL